MIVTDNIAKARTPKMAKILVVDDDKSMLGLFQTRLGDAYQIVKTDDAEEALALSLQQKPDCIVLDLSMPKFSGFELCQALFSLSTTNRIPIFVISGKPASEYRDFCLNLGAREYFEKPVDFNRLRKSLSEVVNEPHRERRLRSRARLSVILKLKLLNESEKTHEFLTVSQDVSVDGFPCACPGDLPMGAILTVSIMSGGRERDAGRAKVVRVERSGTPARRYGFQFIEKSPDWILVGD